VLPRRAAIIASASSERLLEECAKDERSLSLINTAVTELEQAELPKKLKKTMLGDWRLAFAGDQEAANMLLASKANPILTIEGVLACFSKGDAMRAIEVSRPFGPFSNRRKVLEGRWGLEKSGEVRFRYTYLMEGRSRREEDVPESAKGTQTAQVTHVSEELLVLRRSATSFLLFEKVDLQQALEELRAADTVEDDKSLSAVPLAGGQGSSLPPMPKVELPKLELPKGLPKLPKLPF
jgi:hypothetical protein